MLHGTRRNFIIYLQKLYRTKDQLSGNETVRRWPAYVSVSYQELYENQSQKLQYIPVHRKTSYNTLKPVNRRLCFHCPHLVEGYVLHSPSVSQNFTINPVSSNTARQEALRTLSSSGTNKM